MRNAELRCGNDGLVHHGTSASNRLVGLVLDQSDNHAVEVEEEHDEVESELGE